MKTSAERNIDRAHETKIYFAKLYKVPTSCVVWLGGNKFIIVKDGKEIRVG